MEQLKRQQRTLGSVLEQKECGGMEYLQFPLLKGTGLVEHLFTTRIGGVSKGMFATMNLSFSRGDDPKSVLENYRRVGKILGCEVVDFVATRQTHTVNIRRVGKKERGMGVVCPTDYEDVDGLITNEPGIALAAFTADCVPIYFVDVKNKAIGIAHSGWRGTVQKMAVHMVEAMEQAFGTRPEDLTVAIGPSICQECYEVDQDVADQFFQVFSGKEGICSKLRESGIYEGETIPCHIVGAGKVPGKYQLDLWLANAVLLLEAGVCPQNLSITDICTCHNPDYLFSHRASGGKRGNLGAFLMLKRDLF